MDRIDWQNSPYTRQLIERLREQQQGEIAALIKAATEATDPTIQKHAIMIRCIDLFIGNIDHIKGDTEDEENTE